MSGLRRSVLLLCATLPVVGAGAPAQPPHLASAAPPADLSQLQIARIVYDSIGGMGEAYYQFEGRLWARWETDHPQAEQNLGKRLNQLTRIATATEPRCVASPTPISATSR